MAGTVVSTTTITADTAADWAPKSAAGQAEWLGQAAAASNMPSFSSGSRSPDSGTAGKRVKMPFTRFLFLSVMAEVNRFLPLNCACAKSELDWTVQVADQTVLPSRIEP